MSSLTKWEESFERMEAEWMCRRATRGTGVFEKSKYYYDALVAFIERLDKEAGG